MAQRLYVTCSVACLHISVHALEPPIAYVCSFPLLINSPRANRHHSLKPRAVLIALWILVLDVQNTVETVYPWMKDWTWLWRGCASVLGEQDGPLFTGKSNRFLQVEWISKHSCSSWGVTEVLTSSWQGKATRVMWNAVIFRRVPTRGEVKWLHHDVYQRSRHSGSNLRDQLGPAMADRSPPCWVGLDSAYWGVPIMGDARQQLSNRFLCVHVQFCFPLVRFDDYHDFPASLTCFELSAIFNSSLHIRGGPHPFSSCECTNSYFLPLETFARVRKKPCHWDYMLN